MVGTSILAFASYTLVKMITEKGAESISYKVPDDLAEQINKNVIGHAAAGAAAGVASGFLPGVGAVISTGVAIGAIWSMYIRIGNLCGIPFKKNLLKSIASAILANVITGIAGTLVFGVVSSFVPGLASAVEAIVNFVAIYAAGIIFIKMLTMLVEKNGANFDILSEEDLKKAAKEASDNTNITDISKEAKSVFKDMKKDGSLEEMGKSFDINPQDDSTQSE
ncbi:MAG: hypothetical protein IJS17_02005 [Clostridia bacterium]|nr:hypothetical protein [Clostridia bacterium]